jgi:dienelactone hydrolase
VIGARRRALSATSVRGDVGGADYADVMAAVDVAIERGLADPDRLGIGGWSQGGYMTAWAITQTDRFKAGIMGAGISDWNMLTLTSDLPHFDAEPAGSRPLGRTRTTQRREALTDLIHQAGDHAAVDPARTR